MEHYYFIIKNGSKEGPLKLTDLAQQIVYSDDLVWRSDNDQWKKALEFEELRNTIILNPPPTPKEQKLLEFNQSLKTKLIGRFFISYLITSFLIGFIAFGITITSYNSSSNSNVYNRNYNEFLYAQGESFLFRPLKAFYDTIYLTRKEQDSSETLLGNLFLSSLVSFSFIFLGIGIIYYLIKRSSIEKIKS